jgi:hypothetical protein
MDDALREARARQYAVCSYALRHDRVQDGAEAIFDQALTNGLVAIVAHTWPGEEVRRRGAMKSASELLDVIEQHGTSDDDGAVRVPDDPDGPEFEDDPIWGRVENFATVDVPALRDALDVTQAIRHARPDGDDAVLSERHIEALTGLDRHAALFGISDELVERAQAGIAGRDAAERTRAGAYYRALGDEERQRREAIDYAAEYAWETQDDRTVVDECPVCENRALVAPALDGVIEEIGIGFCFVCSYHRTQEVAIEQAHELHIEQSLERLMQRDD